MNSIDDPDLEKKNSDIANKTIPSREVGQTEVIENNSIKDSMPKKKSFWSRKKLFLSIFLICSLLFLGVAVYGFESLNQSNNSNLSASGILSSLIKNSVQTRTPLKGEFEDRINLMIYGMTLDEMRTDSLILVSIYPKEHKVTMLNLPRDTYAFDGYETDKLVSVYTYAKLRAGGDDKKASQFTTDYIAKEFGINIPYWIRIDMNGFKKLVDQLGGVQINVENAFTDYEYPTDDYSGYIRPAPSFTPGMQTMNGTTALIYARSRHSLDNNEGTDFARSHRQQVVLKAILDKVKSKGIIDNVGSLNSYLGLLNQYTLTNITSDEIASAIGLAKDYSSTDLLQNTWSTGNGFLCDSTASNGGYIILFGTEGDCVIGTQSEMGRDSKSNYHQMATNYVQDLLNHSINSTILSKDLVIIGNASDTTDTITKAATKLGYTNLYVNNASPYITKATSSSTEVGSVYIPDEQNKALFKSLIQNSDLNNLTFLDSVPSNIKNLAVNKDSIYIFVQSV